ncbi:MAG: hypothetical protein ABIF77_00035, partial [bacterium]
MKRLGLAMLLLVLSLILVLLAAGGCDDSTRPCSLLVPGGRIQGVVRTGGLFGRFEVTAIAVVEGNLERARYSTNTDDRGIYSLDLPNGGYVLQLVARDNSGRYHYTESGIGHGNMPPDTLQVHERNTPVVIDFELGG